MSNRWFYCQQHLQTAFDECSLTRTRGLCAIGKRIVHGVFWRNELDCLVQWQSFPKQSCSSDECEHTLWLYSRCEAASSRSKLYLKYNEMNFYRNESIWNSEQVFYWYLYFVFNKRVSWCRFHWWMLWSRSLARAMHRQERRTTLSTIRHRRYRSRSVNLNGNGKTFVPFAEDQPTHSDRSPRYRRNYVRFRTSASRSRSREKSRGFRLRPSIDYREKLVLLGLQTIALLHFCTMIYCHHQLPSLMVKYSLVTFVLFNLLTYSCVQYDTREVKHGRLLLGESPVLFLFWYGGLFGGGLALLAEKHKHLRSHAFTCRLRMMIICNATWPFIVYILYMCRNEFLLLETSGVLFSFLEIERQSQ